MDLKVDGKADVVGDVILAHVHDVVQLVSYLLRGFLFISNYTAPLQNTRK